MKRYLPTLFLWVATLSPLCLGWSQAKQPNVVIILSDDQAWDDYGFMGHPSIQTPQLDQLAAQSLLFERGYVASPLCRPSIASMVTGLYPFDHGITGNDVDGPNNRAELDKAVQANFHRNPSFIKSMVESGYLAHQSGKWWEGSYADGGFTHGMTHGDPERGGRHGDAGLKVGRNGIKPIKQFVNLALEQEKPFLIWYAPFLPHTPHNPPDHFLKKYIKEGRAMDVAKYYAMCEWFDTSCGELLGYLDEKKVSENTIVIYLCDNGWAAASTNADDPNQKQWKRYALGSKASPYEDGIRTPIMISWPGHIRPERSGDLAHAIDLFPTLAALLDIDRLTDLPGINLLNKKARQNRERVFGVCHAVYNMTVGEPDDTLKYLWCVEDEWKLLLRYPGKDTTYYKKLHAWDQQPVRLYHIKSDPHEKNELSGKYPEIVARMKKQIENWHPVAQK